MNLKQRIAGTIIARLELKGWTPETFPMDAPLFEPKPGGFGLDSLAALEIIMALSEELEHPLPGAERADLASVTTLAALVRRVGKQR